jgi:SagB-type dehydrogenase family enzyme
MSQPIDPILAYHNGTKHFFNRYAPGPGGLDWVTQPNPFRRYSGAATISLPHFPPGRNPLPGEDPPYDGLFASPSVASTVLDADAIGRLFYDSLALSAWKEAGPNRWALRVNPSSGNLHPTEGYLICGPVSGLCTEPIVAHYAAQAHALEVRQKFSKEIWARLVSELPSQTILLGLSSIHWREAWKYGARAFRYCQHDVGHAIAAITVAAAGMGWNTRLLDSLGDDQVANLLGIPRPNTTGEEARLTDGMAEPEHPDVMLCLYPQGDTTPLGTLDPAAIDAIANGTWEGRPNPLSPTHVEWNPITLVTRATTKPPTPPADAEPAATAELPLNTSTPAPKQSMPLRQVIRERRSAVAMDSVSEMPTEAFFRTMGRLMPGSMPFDTMPFPPAIHLLLFVHRVTGMTPGLYLLVRDPGKTATLRHALSVPDFLWEPVKGCPESLPLFFLAEGDATGAARALSCQQDIAAQGAFSLGMLADFERVLNQYGPWYYRNLFWEAGMLGQILYLEATAQGLGGTGIGCFFDDPVHELFGIEGTAWQSLYHFTVGGPVVDTRLKTLPPYESQNG